MNDFLTTAGDVAVTAAKEAGAALLRHYRKKLHIQIKDNNPRNMVTNADKEAHRIIVKTITESFPRHTVISEEGETELGSKFAWHVDPLDGTTNYTLGNNYFATSIALAKGPELLIGAVYSPVAGELYTAVEGRGAFLNGKRLAVSKKSKIGQIAVCSDLGYSLERRSKTLRVLSSLIEAKAIRLKGCGALALCELAAGSEACYFHIGSKSYDYAAGALLVREAGGAVKDFDGKDWAPETKSGIVAGGEQIIAQLLPKLKVPLK